MSVLSFCLVLSILVSSLVLLFLGLALLKKPSLKAAFVLLMVLFSIVNVVWLFWRDSGLLNGIGGVASILTFPLATIVVLLFLYPENPAKQVSWSVFLILPAVGLGAWSFTEDMGSDMIYGSSLIYLFTIICTGVGIVESTWGWVRLKVLRSHSYLFLLALFALLTTGPLYGFELEMLGFQSLIGANLGAPIVGAFLLAPLLMANPIVSGKSTRGYSARARVTYHLKPGRCYAISEKRPKYCYTFFKDTANAGYPSLLVTCASIEELKRGYSLTGVKTISLSTKDTSESLKVTNLGRVLTTVIDFLKKRRNPVLLIDGLHYLLSNNDMPEVTELLQSLMESVERRRGWLLISFSLLTKDEEREVLSLGLTHLKMPPPEQVVAKILHAHTGELSSHLLKLSCRMLNRRIRDFRAEDIPDLSRVVTNTMRALGAATNESAIMENWETQSWGIRDSFYHFYKAPVSFLASGEWMTWDPLKKEGSSKERKEPKVETTKQRPMKKGALEYRPEQVDLTEEVMSIFTNCLGDFGNSLLRIECASLGIKEGAMTQRDIEKLAEKAAKTISELGDFVDVPIAGKPMKLKAEGLKQELERISKEELAC